MNLEPTTEVNMTDRPVTKNPGTGPNEPLYTRAEFEVKVNEIVAARLTELGYTPRTQTHPPTVSSISEKGKEPEVVNLLLKEQNAAYHGELLEKAVTPKEI